MRKIKSVRFESEHWAPTKVIALFDDGEEKKIFDFFNDEIYFDESELIGLTEDEAFALKRNKDIAYLRS